MGVPALVALVVAVVLIVVATGGGSTKHSSASHAEANPAPSGVVAAVTQIPASVYDTVGMPAGSVTAPPILEKGQAALTSGGKPEILYIGEEWCPYCAAARWAMAAALARFGTFSGLRVTQSSSSDVYPDTNTLSFYHSTYTSPILTFVPVEEQNTDHQTIQPLTRAQAAIQNRYDSQGSVPFIDIGNKYVINGTYSPQVLQGLDWGQIASQLSNPASPVTKDIVGAANFLTAAICKVVPTAPASVCTTAGVKAAAAILDSVK